MASLKRLFRPAAPGAASNSTSDKISAREADLKRPHRVPAVTAQQPSIVHAKYSTACTRITQRYPESQPQEILSELVIKDVDRDKGSGEATGYTGGETLACYLFSIKEHERLAGGIGAWLNSKLSIYQECPGPYACLLRAIDFLPQLQAAMMHPVVERPAGLTAQMNLALPVRREEIGESAASRADIRHAFMDSATATGAFMAQLEVNATKSEAPTFFREKHPLARGRLLGPGHLVGANRLVQAKLTSSQMREANSDDEPEDEEPQQDEGEEGMPEDPFVRFDGRWDNKQPKLLGGSRPGFQYEPPFAGKEMLGWKVQATFQTGPTKELKWHDGFIMEWQQLKQRAAGSSSSAWGEIFSKYRMFFKSDTHDEWISEQKLPHTSICFRKPNLKDPRVLDGEIAQAKAAVQGREAAEGSSDDDVEEMSASEFRAAADWQPAPAPAPAPAARRGKGKARA